MSNHVVSKHPMSKHPMSKHLMPLVFMLCPSACAAPLPHSGS